MFDQIAVFNVVFLLVQIDSINLINIIKIYYFKTKQNLKIYGLFANSSKFLENVFIFLKISVVPIFVCANPEISFSNSSSLVFSQIKYLKKNKY